ncbi:hypothetical protein RRG08_024134 [Elysia crispata]|uniref:Uncharacterized protein n=1 Tax=Elysia crispata TaxID=231223 RepID=A0AAE1D2G1_9GAST|nr:hypothetical protein RRG08_024134 [Elysia crispata]
MVVCGNFYRVHCPPRRPAPESELHGVSHSQFLFTGSLHRTAWRFPLSVPFQRFSTQNCMVFPTPSSFSTVLYTELHGVSHSQFLFTGSLHRTAWCFPLSVHFQQFPTQNCMVFPTLSSLSPVICTERHGVSHSQFTMNGSLHRTAWCFPLSVHHERFFTQNGMVFPTLSSLSPVICTELHDVSHSQFPFNGSLHRTA